MHIVQAAHVERECRALTSLVSSSIACSAKCATLPVGSTYVSHFMLLCCPVQLVIDFFNSRLDAIKSNAAAGPESQSEWSVAKVLSLVNNFAQVSQV